METLILVIIDQLIKYFVTITNPNISFIKDVFQIQYVKNTGGIYGIFQGSNIVFIALSLVILLIILYLAWKEKEKNHTRFLIWQMILAGGISNVIDRIVRGFVVDYVQLRIFQVFDFGVFNVADVMIVIGVVSIILIEIKEIIHESNRNKSHQ